ncbi:lysosomal alpha-glucosidase-like [Cydia fagiglandana]|uniref:lysosomal alpha-glucosidase-like n=1 Tax=Cydia fagiglandana TaxID=1458189 RepID=UPI002FEE4B1D
MPKVPYKSSEQPRDDEDYEIVSFEDFCDKSPGSKTDLLTLNDNINYRICYEGEKPVKFVDDDGGTSSRDLEQLETSLNGSKASFKERLSNFAPFGKASKTTRGSPFSGVIPKARAESDSPREHRYQRFSSRRNICQRVCDGLPCYGSGLILVIIVCALCAGAWWAVCGAVGGAWGEEHYRRLWERAHPDNVKKPPTPITYEKILPEFRYHDHNNLSTKNKLNATELSKKKPDLYKKAYTERPPEVMSDICAQIEDNMRFDCFPQDGANEKDCVQRGCCWLPAKTQGAPYCYYPPQYDTYRFANMTETKHGATAYYQRMRPSGYPADFEIARMDFKYLSDDVLQIKIYDAENKRFEPPYPEIPMVPGPISNLKYRVQIESATVGFKVIRNSDNVTLINTQDVGGLILSDKFLQLSAILPSSQIYGLGERQSRFKLDINWKTYAMFNYDTAPTENTNLYGTHPFYLNLEPSGNSHGMLLLNSYAMDVILQPAPAITYRTTGGVLNLFVFAGPAPAAVAAQYTALVGRPAMPPYWALGFHLCKYDYGSLNVTRDVWQKNRDAGIPFDVQWNDLDYMNNSNDFTYDKVKYAGLPEFVDELHKDGMHYVVLIDPGVSAGEAPGDYPPFDRGVELDIFIKNATKQPFIGKTWNKISTAYPDFTHPSATAYWVEMMTSLHKEVPFDGAWIDMNEPSNMLSGPLHGSCAPEDLPYKPHTSGADGLRSKTICMEAQHYAGSHRDWHNLYSLTEAVATDFALTEIRGKRPFIISRSTFVGSGRYAGHWSGDVFSEWHDMAMSIPEILSFSLFGIPMMGADICGFNGDTTVELCKRWMQLGAFYPFSRNHNSDRSIPQDPVSLGPEVVEASKQALRTRYRLLPYYYTLFWRAHVAGETVARPLFFETPDNPVTHDIDAQFLIGPYLMISPILEQGARTTRAYFPGAWYNLQDGTMLAHDQWNKLDENQTVAVRGGGVIPLQEPPAGAVSTARARSAPLQLLAAPAARRAAGQLYWDHGDTLRASRGRGEHGARALGAAAAARRAGRPESCGPAEPPAGAVSTARARSAPLQLLAAPAARRAAGQLYWDHGDTLRASRGRGEHGARALGAAAAARRAGRPESCGPAEPPAGAVSTARARSAPLQLLAAPAARRAAGQLYWDHGDTLRASRGRGEHGARALGAAAAARRAGRPESCGPAEPPAGAVSTARARSAPLQLLAAPAARRAAGQLYWDHGDTLRASRGRGEHGARALGAAAAARRAGRPESCGPAEPPAGAVSTARARSAPLQLLAAPAARRAAGQLYWDHGDTLRASRGRGEHGARALGAAAAARRAGRPESCGPAEPPAGAVSTARARSAPLQLLAAPAARRAAGQLYWDHGDTLRASRGRGEHGARALGAAAAARRAGRPESCGPAEPPAGAVSTARARSAPLQLLAAPAARRAAGQLYWDHGDTLSE